MSNPAPLRTAEIIAVGSELLGSTRLDTNSLYISERLSTIGIELRSKTVAGDNRDLIAELCRHALARVDLVVVTGGLGPTDDDLTRDAIAAVVGLPLVEHADLAELIAARFARRGLKMPEINRRQAQVIEGATVLANPNGTAPGQYLEHGDRVIVLLPGPPRELQPMLVALCDGPLGARAARERILRTSIFVTGRSESHVEEAAQPLYALWRAEAVPIETTILARRDRSSCTSRSDPRIRPWASGGCRRPRGRSCRRSARMSSVRMAAAWRSSSARCCGSGR